ncbi:Glu/Leu/Phe/Val family dehydrogenase [Thermosediminibacter oceani]|uniref:Leucine dehydrogenase n=1 Tax=Thermosediminibacter oceani (strain ATCC BAA-1034 / DSM 16646 / JW/IW-1228P) TaxID=555079 RepID=D9S2G6_THEOJ|nr:Glu/Leu/Phe/Val dehydrogenase [Thermosediminibacter oceani]ADL07593.1 leucine dehydrogenase [Thermosediminibacter oceani DSM 16646]
MELFKVLGEMGHEEVVFCNDPESGLKAIIAVHNTNLGPALGGCRMWNYASEEDAIRDVLRLSRGMTYKNAMMNLPLGGGKSVIIGDPRKDKSEKLFRAFGKFVNSLGGKYITAEDVGTSPEDMKIVVQETSHVAGLDGKSGDPSPITALGVFLGIKACCEWVYGSDDLKDKTVALQGLGHVGMELVRLLTEAGAKLVVTDIYADRINEAKEKYGVQVVEPEKIYDVPCDIFAPCALGAVINENTVDRLKCKIVAGCANNQLKEESFAEKLAQRGILYAPDYVINGGGVINVSIEVSGQAYSRELVNEKLQIIPKRLKEVFQFAEKEGITTARAADIIAEKIFMKK